MQNQLTRNTTQSISQTQSLAAVQTLLRAGLGTITYLRNLLPEDNFTRSHFTSVDDTGTQCDASQESTASRMNVSGFRITTITRGYTDEADRILNYMEYGIFDALEKRYLRSFIFGIYLDTKDPTNIIEAYTFNFKYHTIPGSDMIIPVMSLAQTERSTAMEDPVTKAIKQGKPPTLKDVKMSVKALLKTLIQAISNMDVLPRRRFATFKVFYTEDTPPDYEPPHFEPGDVDKDRWYFMTHDLDEVPERTSIGKINTGHHSVNLNVTSIASYLPSSSEQADDSTFCGLTTNPSALNHTPLEEAALRKNQAEKQLEDAKTRNLLWPVEDVVELDDVDAEGEDDPDYIRLPDGRYEKIDSISPIGIRDELGAINTVKYPIHGETVEEFFSGVSEVVPKHLRDMAVEKSSERAPELEETQIMITPERREAPATPTSRTSNNSNLTPTALSTAPTSPVDDIGLKMWNNMHIDVPNDTDNEMLDLETQAQIVPTLSPQSNEQAKTYDISISSSEHSDKGLACDCGIMVEDQTCFCEGGCKHWFHIWCMGYHTVEDARLPSVFICFDCRLRRDAHWDLIKVDLYPQMISKFKDIALFRRAIKVAQRLQQFSSAQYSKEFGGDVVSAGQMLRALEDQEFVLQQSVTLDDLGVTVTTLSKKGKSGKGISHKPKTRKNVQKPKYVFNNEITTKDCFLNYFNPNDRELEAKLLGISEMVRTSYPNVIFGSYALFKMDKIKPKYTFNKSLHTERKTVISETQTQQESQETGEQTIPKRSIHSEDAGSRPFKKFKMSVAIGVDLAE